MRKYEIARTLGKLEQENTMLLKRNAELQFQQPDAQSWVNIGFADADVPKTTELTITLPEEARIPVLAVALMLKNRADAMDVAEGSHIPLVLEQYDRVEGLYKLLGATSTEEHNAALSLWDETAA